MAGGKQTPRQAMIGLMYLVLLAMLAMNASKDLLNAFVMLERGIDVTNVNFAIKNQDLYRKLQKAADANPAKKPLLDKALAIQKEADALFELIALHKTSLVSKGELKTFADTANGKLKEYYDEHGIPLAKDDQDFGATYFMVLEEGKKGKELQAAINKFTTNCVAIVKEDKTLKDKIEKMLATHEHEHDGVKAPWISSVVEHLPLAAVTANLTNIQTYVRNAESEVVEHLLLEVDGKSLKFNAIEALAIPKSGYVLKGDSIKVTMFTAAYDNTQDPVVYLGYPDSTKFDKDGLYAAKFGDTKPPMLGSQSAEWNETASTYQLVKTRNGKGEFGKRTGASGDKKIKGVIGIKTPDGIKYYMFKNNYMVAEPSATIAASKMNVLYVGVPNPMQISAPGVALKEIKPSGAGISFSKGSKEGEYIATCANANPKGTEITVSKTGGGKLGGSIFRIKRLPDPVASILGQKEGLVSKGKLKAASFLKAEMENFDFDVKVNVISFKMTASLGGDLKEFVSRDNKLTGPMMTMLGSVRAGDRIYFEEIKVAMPDKTTRKVPSIILKVQ